MTLQELAIRRLTELAIRRLTEWAQRMESERDAARSEVERLERERVELNGDVKELCDKLDEARAEVERLRDELRALRGEQAGVFVTKRHHAEALADIATRQRGACAAYLRDRHGCTFCVDAVRATILVTDGPVAHADSPCGGGGEAVKKRTAKRPQDREKCAGCGEHFDVKNMDEMPECGCLLCHKRCSPGTRTACPLCVGDEEVKP